MMATLQQLVKVKSALAEDLERYYMALLEKRDRTPWYRVGKVIRASEVAVPARVLKEDTRPPRLPVPGQAGEGDGAKDLAHNYFDPEIALYYEEPTLDKRREEVLWKEELQRLRQATAFKPVVIIGAPGGGKSFLTDTTVIELTSEALTQLREQTQPLEELPLPIHLELADLAQQKLPDDLAAALLELLRTRYAISARLDEWMQAKLKTNDCWLMLDALDQVPETDRPQLQERLGLLETQPDWRCRVVLTCRTANYDRAQLPWNEVTEYELSPFRPQEIRQFVGRWFDSDKPRGESLRQALSRNYSLSHACRTPLLVTLTCLAHEEIAVTEETRRVDLYAHVLRGLVRRAWKTNPLNPHDPHIGDVLRPLPAIARKLFESRPESNQFTENEVYQAIKAAPDLPSAPIPFRQELFDAGLLVGAGLSRIGELQFSFLHRSFLEYLNACALDNQVEKEGWGAIATLIDKKAWHPAWHESIAFLAGKLKNPIALLELLADLDSDDLFRHRLCLAAHCLPELTAHNTLKTILYLDKSTVEYKDKLQTLTQCIARDVFNIWLADYERFIEFPHVEECLPRIAQSHATTLLPDILDSRRIKPQIAIDVVGKMGAAIAQHHNVIIPLLRAALGDVISDGDGHSLGRMCVVAASLPEVIPTLQAAIYHSDYNVRQKAIGAFGHMGDVAAQHPEVISGLLSILSNPNSDEHTLSNAARALGRMGATAAQHPETIPSLLWILRHNRDWPRRRIAIYALGQMGAVAAQHPKVIPTLLAAMHDPEWSKHWNEVMGKVNMMFEELDVYWPIELERSATAEAAIALGQMGVGVTQHPEVIPALLSALKGTDETVVEEAADALGRIGATLAQPALIAALLEALHNQREDIRRNSARALKVMGAVAAQPEVIRELLSALRDEDATVRSIAAEALGNMGAIAAQHPEVILSLRTALHDAEPSVRWDTVEALGQMGVWAAPSEMIADLLVALRDENDTVRSTTAKALGKIGADAMQHPEVVPSLLFAMHDASIYVRCDAADALVRMDATAVQSEVIATLIEALRGKDAYVGGRAASALVRMGMAAAQPEVIAALLEVRDSFLLKNEVAEALGRIMAQGIRIFQPSVGNVEVKNVADLSH